MASLKEVQKLAGSLNFTCRCVKSGHIYLSRILNFLRSLLKTGKREIPESVKHDVRSWQKFAPLFNGVSLLTEVEWSHPDMFISSDSCLTGGGAFCLGEFVHWCYPAKLLRRKLNINQLECLMVVIALKLWSDKLSRKKLQFNCDNQVTVIALNSGCSRDLVIQACLREIHVMLALSHCEMRAVYLSSLENRISDALSHWHLKEKYKLQFLNLVADEQVLVEQQVSDQLWKFLEDV